LRHLDGAYGLLLRTALLGLRNHFGVFNPTEVFGEDADYDHCEDREDHDAMEDVALRSTWLPAFHDTLPAVKAAPTKSPEAIRDPGFGAAGSS